ncbi:diacylglycerol kinase family protein, partial [Actinomyces gerencseriae]
MRRSDSPSARIPRPPSTHLGLDVVATTGVPLGIAAVGTGNDIARHLRLPRRDVTASVAVTDAALRGEGRR